MLGYPMLEIDLEKIMYNITQVVEKCHQQGTRLTPPWWKEGN